MIGLPRLRNRRALGNRGETIAIQYLTRCGCQILHRNYYTPHGEIDIVFREDGCLVFAEVKTRSVDAGLYSDYGSPASAVTKGKHHRTIAAARAYLSAHPAYASLQPRLDVIEVYLDKENGKVLKIHHIPNAFGVG